MPDNANRDAIGATTTGMTALISPLPAAESRSDAAPEMPRVAVPAYDAFISYSHAKDKPIAAALQYVVQKLGKPWYRRRALRLFRDDTSLTATPHLWPSIERALGQSRFLVLLASSEAAASPWVDKELAWWLDHKSVDTVLIALTDGELSWDGTAGDFRWSPAPPLPPTLKGCFANEPRWIDLRPYRNSKVAHRPEFDDLAADFAAAIHGTPKEDLLSQEVRQQRRALLLAWSAVATLIVFLVVAGWQWRQAETSLVSAIKALSASSKAIFQSNRQLDGLATGVSAGKKLSGSTWQALWLDGDLKESVNGTMQELLRGATEHNRLSVGARVAGVAFAPDDKTIVTRTLDERSLQVWKPDGAPLKNRPWLEAQGGVTDVAFSRDGKVAIAGESHVVVRKLDDGQLVTKLPVDKDKGQVMAIAFSADGKKIAAATTERRQNVGRVQLWNLDDGSSMTLEDPGMTVQMAVAVSPHGEQIAVAGWYGAFLWNTNGTKPTALVPNSGSVNTVAFSPDGTLIATSGDDKVVKLWKKDGTLSQTLYGHADAVWGLSFRPDSRVVASASTDRTVKVWQIDGTLLSTLAGHGDEVKAVTFSHDGKKLASASHDGTVKLWELGGPPALKALPHDQTVHTAAFSPNGRILLTTSGHGWLTLWNPDGTLLTRQKRQYGPITAVAFSRDGKMMATAGADRTVMLRTIDGVTFTKEELLEGQEGRDGQNTVLALSFSPDGKTIAAGGVSSEVRVWNTGDRQRWPKPLRKTKADVTGVDFSHDGKNIAVADGSGAVVVVNSVNGTLVSTLQEGGSRSSPVYGIRYSPDGKTIAAASADAVRIWPADGKRVTTLSGHEGAVVGFAFSPDGKWVASASRDGTVAIWTADGKRVTTLSGHEGAGSDFAVSRVAFSPDGKTVASASEGRTVILWNWQKDLSLDGTLANACQWIRDYLTNNSKDDQHLCDGIPSLQ